jgi:hypothetical protein
MYLMRSGWQHRCARHASDGQLAQCLAAVDQLSLVAESSSAETSWSVQAWFFCCTTLRIRFACCTSCYRHKCFDAGNACGLKCQMFWLPSASLTCCSVGAAWQCSCTSQWTRRMPQMARQQQQVRGGGCLYDFLVQYCFCSCSAPRP